MAQHMTEEEAVKPLTAKPRYTPLFLWKETHCKHCTIQNHCTPASEAHQRCILAHIALNLEQLRILIQQRTQHLSW